MDVQAVAGPSRIPYQNGHIEEDGIAGQPSVTVTVREVTIPADVEPSSIPASTAASASIQAGPSGQSSSSSLQDNDRHLHTAANPVSSAVYSTNHPALRRFRTGQRGASCQIREQAAVFSLVILTSYTTAWHALATARLLLRFANDPARVPVRSRQPRRHAS